MTTRWPARGVLSRNDLVELLDTRDAGEIERIGRDAHEVLLRHCGAGVYLRGLVEASNACACDCLYCGIRKSNRDVRRYTLEADEIVACARHCAERGFGSLVIQSGERRDKAFLDMTLEVLRRIKRETRSSVLPDGLGVTLSIGQQSRETYRRLFEAGAHRYLLRIETSNPRLFARIHPDGQSFASRLECLGYLRETGYQVGTGVMIGLPGQTTDDLAGDILFFAEHDIDMIGMGPFIPHPDTPLGGEACPGIPERIRLTLLMIAAARLKLSDVNIASTTALQALDPRGREMGLRFGANVVMPQVTPHGVRGDYLLYPGKPCLEDEAGESVPAVLAEIAAAGRAPGSNVWGDSLHAQRRLAGVALRSAAE